jgi:uncharacterized lipoprotein YmbA
MRWVWLLSLGPLLVMPACATRTGERFYVLPQVRGPSRPAPATPIGTVLVDTIVIPAVVDRPQLVLGAGDQQVAILEHERWAEPLRAAIPRLLVTQLAEALHTTSVSAQDAVLGQPDYRVGIEVRRLELVRGQGATLDLLWSVRRMAGGSRTGQSRFRTPSPGLDTEGLITALGQAVGGVSGEIADAVTALSGAGPPDQPGAQGTR